MLNYAAIIIGSGQAGTPLAFKYALNKKKVAFIEKKHFGGTCLNVGCTPTKAYVASAKRAFDIQRAETLGIGVPTDSKANLDKIKARKDALIQKSVNGLASSLEGSQYIDVYKGEARFGGPKVVEVNGKSLTAENIFIDVGARARIPEGFENVDYLTNEDILGLTEIPEHLLIVGGSYIGLEFGQMFRRFGSRVTIIEKNDRLIAYEDEDVSETIQEILEEEGIEFRFNSDCIGASQSAPGHIKVKTDCDGAGDEILGTHLLLAVGRVPNTDLLNLEAAGIKTNARGYIVVDDRLQTNIEGVYALGDCNGKGAFTHTAYNDYQIVSANILENGNRKVTDRIQTYALFIDPPLGRAGMTLAAAKIAGNKVKTAEYQMANVARAREKGETKGFMRIIIDSDTDRILGASILGVGGDESIASILNVMYADKPYTLIRDSVHIHPTVSELIPTMLEKTKYE
ncbi:MAG: FAD-containing oxidoreductase [Candidatus Syntrophosphaera sp.]|nr:FAD-containing oxidoreductase [Candidatus Syntrophosphaera sp.]